MQLTRTVSHLISFHAADNLFKKSIPSLATLEETFVIKLWDSKYIRVIITFIEKLVLFQI